MAGERIKLFEADIDVEGVVKKSRELKETMTSLQLEQQKLKSTVGESSEEWIKNEARLKKVSSEYRVNQQQVSNLTDATGKLTTVEDKLSSSLEREVKSIQGAVDNNKELRKVRNSINTETVEGQKAIADINKKLDQNTALIKDNTDSYSKQKMEIGGYQDAIEKALGSTRIFGVGVNDVKGMVSQFSSILDTAKKDISGTVDSMKAAKDGAEGMAGAQKMALLSSTALSGGLRILKLALISTGIGAIVVALGSLIAFLSTTQAGMDAVTKVTRPLSAVFQTLLGMFQQLGAFIFENPLKGLKTMYEFVKKNLVESFTGLGKIIQGVFTLDGAKIKEGSDQIKNLADENAASLKKFADGIGDQFAEAYKKGQRIDELQKKFEQSEIDILAFRAQSNIELKKAENIQKNQLLSAEERNAAISEGEKISKELLARENEILDIQIEQLKIKQSLNDTSREEEKQLQELVAQRISNEAIVLDVEKKALGDRKQLHNEAANAAKEAFDQSLKRQEVELQLYLESQGIKAQTLQEELKLAEVVFEKEMAIEKRKLAAKKITHEEYELFILQKEKELSQKKAEIAIDNAKRELDAQIEANQSKLESSKVLTDVLVDEELNRLNAIAEQREQFEKERFDNGLINEMEYQDNVLAIQKEALDKAKDLNDQYEIQKKEEAQLEKEIEFQEELERMEAEGVSKYEIEKERLLFQHEEDVILLDEQREQGLITEAEYNSRRKALDDSLKDSLNQNSKAVAENKIALAEMTFSNLAQILGKESAAGKAVAVAQATIDTYKAAVAAYAAGMSLGGPVGLVMGPVSAGLAVAAGLMNIKKITSTKPPKAERGMAMNIGGNRHAQGGTKFYGEDGTHFEAEAGEKMFILNRNASAALGPLLSDINQQYGGVSLSRASSYLANGGQVYRSAVQQGDSAVNMEMMRKAIREGSAEGTMEGSFQGSRDGSREGSSKGVYSGIVDKETNETIAAGANF